MLSSNKGKTIFLLSVFIYLYFFGVIMNLMMGQASSPLLLLDIFHRSSDHLEFFNPINNLIEYGKYSYDNHAPYAGRLPGYIFPYGIFRILFSENSSLFLLGIFQLLLKTISAYCLIKLLENLSVGRKAQLAAVVLYLFIPYFWHWDYTLHPNSVSASICLILFFYLQRFRTKFDGKYIFFTGLLTCYLFFIRPFLGVFFISTIMFIGWNAINIKISFRQIIIKLFIFLLPFGIVESIWVARNYFSFNKIILLQTSFVPLQNDSHSEYSYGSHAKYSIMKVRELISSWGGETFWYFPGEMNWFVNDSEGVVKYKFKNYVFTPSLTQDSLNYLKELVNLSYHNNFQTKTKDSLEQKIINVSMRYKAYFIKENAFHYYVTSRVLRCYDFLIKNVTQDWPGLSFRKSSVFQKALKIISLLEYSLMLFSFFVIIILAIVKNKFLSPFEMYLSGNVLLLLFSFSFLIDASHYSYFISGYVSVIILLLFQTNKIFIKK